MAYLVLQAAAGEKRFPLAGQALIIGRLPQTDVCIDAPDVSRRHAQVVCTPDGFFVEDLGSSNGTYVNGIRIKSRTLLETGDTIGIGIHVLAFESDALEPSFVIHSELVTHHSNDALFQLDPSRKLRAVLDIAHQLSQLSNLDDLLHRLLDHLLALFPKADRGLVLLRERDRLIVRASRARGLAERAGDIYSRSVVQRVLAEGVALMAAEDAPFQAETLRAAGVRSFICVPLKARGPTLGVLQLDCSGIAASFTADDLHLLTAVSLQVSAVLENTTLHNELVEQERVKRDLALARLAQLAAGVAHEVNNPLSFVLNNTTVCRRDIEALGRLLDMYNRADAAPPEQRPVLAAEITAFRGEIDLDYTLKNLDDMLARSRDGLKRIQQIVQDLRTFARLHESEVDTVDLAPCLNAAAGIARGLAERRGVKLTCELAPLPRLACQPARINQAVFNLLSNAVDAAPSGGQVTLRAAQTEERIEIHVLDDGPGVDPAIRDKIFDPFFTTKALGQGVGLGLSISHGIVTDHGGAISLESTGRGAHFIIRLPLRGIPSAQEKSEDSTLK